MDHFQRLHEPLVSDCQWVFFLRWQKYDCARLPPAFFLLQPSGKPATLLSQQSPRVRHATWFSAVFFRLLFSKHIGRRPACRARSGTYHVEWLARRNRLGKVDKLG
jgi:hypothetical protein